MHHNPFENKSSPCNPFDIHDQKPTNPFEDQKPFLPFELNVQQQMFNAQPVSRPASAMPQNPGQVPPMMFNFNNALNPLMYLGRRDYEPCANGIPNNRVNNWLNNFGSSTPGVPSVLSQLSLGAATASQLSLMSQHTRLSMIKAGRDDKFERADLDYLLRCLNDNFDLLDVEVNSSVLEIIGGITRIDKDMGIEVANALWKAMAKLNYSYLIGNQPEVLVRLDLFHDLVRHFHRLNRQYNVTNHLNDDNEKQRVVQALLILMRHRFDEPLLQVLNIVVSRSIVCQRLLCVRNDPSRPHLDSMMTLRRLGAHLAGFQLRQRPRAIYAFLNLFLTLLTCYQTREELQSRSRLELCEVFMAECAGHIMSFMDESTQLISTNNVQPPQQRLSNIEMFESIVRYTTRLLLALSEIGLLEDRLIDLKVFELAAIWIPRLKHTSRTGYETRRSIIRTFANLSSCGKKLRNRPINDAVLFTLDCINQIYQYTPDQINSFKVQAPETVVRAGAGFLSNVSRYNVHIQSLLSQNQNSMVFLIELGGGCANFLQEPNLGKARTELLIDIIDFSVETLCHLCVLTNPYYQVAAQFLVNNPGFLFFTNFTLFQTDKTRLPAIVVILKMWNQCMESGFFPPIQNIEQTDITSGLLGFFTQRILDVSLPNQSEHETRQLETALSLAQKVIQRLIDGQPMYAQLIEQKLCHVNRELRPFQLLNKLNPTSARLMLNFLVSCFKLEQLKQLWMNERDYQGNSLNQPIINQFRQSADSNISSLSSLIYQQLSGGDFSMADVLINY